MIISQLIQKIQQNASKKRIVFPEGHNPLIQNVARRLLEQNLATPCLVFNRRQQAPSNLAKGIQVFIIEEFPLDSLVQAFYQVRQGKVDLFQSHQLLQQSNYFAMMLLHQKRVDCFLGGIEYATADILRPAFQIIKVQPTVASATSAFLMTKDGCNFLFADCALNIDPSATDLVNITKNTVQFANSLDFHEKKIALLSFSTAGSGGKHQKVEKVQVAQKILSEHFAQTATVLGDIQFDAAFSQRVRTKKWKDRNVNFIGSANIFIFPDLNAANIGYKIAQHLGHFKAIGPIIIGLNAPVNDLSRGATEEDIYQTAIVTISQVNASVKPSQK